MNIRTISLAAAVVLTGATLFAAIPLNPIGPKESDAVAPARPIPLPHTKPTDWPRSLAALNARPLSGAYYNGALKSLIERGIIAPAVSQSLSFSSAASSVGTPSKHGRFSAVSLAVPNFFETGEHNTTNGAGRNPAEPVTVAANSPNGSTYTVNAWFGYTAGSDYSIMTNYSTDRVNYSTPAELPRPVAYQDQGGFMGDPSISVTLTDGTYTPRVYVSAVAYHRSGSPSGQGGIYVYGTANGGQTWEGPVEVAVSADANRFFDQSAMTTSWATNSNTAGMKFIAYALYDTVNPLQGSIRIRRSRSPIFCFGRCHAVCPCVPTFDAEVTVTTGNVASPQVAVDASGAVHVTYVRYGATVNDPSSIEEVISNVPLDPSTENISFGTPQRVAYFYEVSSDHINGNVHAISIPRMRYDAVADKICLTWHATDSPGGSIVQVYFAWKAINNGSWPGTFVAPIFSVAGRDLFMPALDADESGNVLLGWYDRRDSAANLEYRPYVGYISSTGGVILGPSSISSISSTPSFYFIGDYHEIWRHNYPDAARWNNVWIAHPGGFFGDVYVTDVR